MKKLLREDGPILLISLVVTYIAFRGALGWEWSFIGAAVFAVAMGLLSAVVIQAVVILVSNKRRDSESGDDQGEAERDATEAKARDKAHDQSGAGGHGGDNEHGSKERFSADDTSADDGTASGTGAEESGPQGRVHRSEEYRSSLEDPD